MKILGVDPGLKATGYGCIESMGGIVRLIETGTINPKVRQPLPQRLLTVHRLLGEVVVKYRPDVLVLEKVYAHSSYPTTIGILGHVRGVICLVCAEHDLPLAEYSVKRIRKAVVGNGNATKVQTQQVVAQLLRIDAMKLTLDASDALALSVGHMRMQKRII